MVRYAAAPPRSADLVVIGGGVIGAATAFFASRAGLSSVVIERRPQLGTLTTAASAGGFRAQFDNAEEVALMQRSIALFAEMAERADLELRQQGYLWVTTTDAVARRQASLVDHQRGWGLPDAELLDGDAARRRFPHLGANVLSARYRAADGWLAPRRLTMAYAEGAERSTFVTDTSVTGIVVESGRATGVRTSRGDVSCGAVVVAAGPFSGELARLVGLDLSFEIVRRQKLFFPDLPERPAGAPMTIDEDTGAHWRPTERGAYLMWPTPDEPPGPPREDVPTSSDWAFALLDPASPRAVARVSPFWRRVWEQGRSDWLLAAGQYTVTPDHRPLLGPTVVDGLYLNAGWSGHGVMGSAAGSELLVDQIVGRRAAASNPFRVDRVMVARERDVL